MEAPQPDRLMADAVRYSKTTLVGISYLLVASVVFSLISSFFHSMLDTDDIATSDTFDLVMQVCVQLLIIVIVSVMMQRMIPSIITSISRTLGVNLFVASEAEIAMFLLMAVIFNSGSLKDKIDELSRRFLGSMYSAL